MIGIILLAGIVTKNAILLVDFANQERAKGVALKEAILTAGLSGPAGPYDYAVSDLWHVACGNRTGGGWRMAFSYGNHRHRRPSSLLPC